jgi:hypothetical protein
MDHRCVGRGRIENPPEPFDYDYRSAGASLNTNTNTNGNENGNRMRLGTQPEALLQTQPVAHRMPSTTLALPGGLPTASALVGTAIRPINIQTPRGN